MVIGGVGLTRVAPSAAQLDGVRGDTGVRDQGEGAISIQSRDEKANSNLKMRMLARWDIWVLWVCVYERRGRGPVWLSARSKLHWSQAWSAGFEGALDGSNCPVNPENDQRPKPATALREEECLLGDGEGWRGRERRACGGHGQSGCRPALATMQLRFSPARCWGLSFTRCRPAPHHHDSANGTGSGFAAAGEEQATCSSLAPPASGMSRRALRDPRWQLVLFRFPLQRTATHPSNIRIMGRGLTVHSTDIVRTRPVPCLGLQQLGRPAAVNSRSQQPATSLSLRSPALGRFKHHLCHTLHVAAGGPAQCPRP